MPDISFPLGSYANQVSPRARHAAKRLPPTVRATLPCPRLEEASPPDVFDPGKEFEVVHVLIEYPQMARNDILRCYWLGEDSLGCTSGKFTVSDVFEGRPVRFAVGTEFVMPNMGRRVRVSYTLWRAGTREYEYSSVLNLLVRELIA
ncbi:hypothetical protein [Pseudomonas sp. R1-6]|uniref:hypothetical protein n=1 Tax=Pseudomonas sp. R1-6 TaxID=2817397 RepID=UPI003DA93D78